VVQTIGLPEATT